MRKEADFGRLRAVGDDSESCSTLLPSRLQSSARKSQVTGPAVQRPRSAKAARVRTVVSRDRVLLRLTKRRAVVGRPLHRLSVVARARVSRWLRRTAERLRGRMEEARSSEGGREVLGAVLQHIVYA